MKRMIELIIILLIFLCGVVLAEEDEREEYAWKVVDAYEAGRAECFTGIAHGADRSGRGVFVALTSGGRVYVSNDGLEWRRAEDDNVSVMRTADRSCVVYMGGRFFVFSEHVYESTPDGMRWREIGPIEQAKGQSFWVCDIAYGNGMFVAVGQGGVSASSQASDAAGSYSRLRARIFVSRDLSDWREAEIGHKTVLTSQLNSVVFAGRGFVAVGDKGLILTSGSGLTWRRQESGTEENLHEIAYGGGKFLAVGRNAIMLVSSDGINWTPLKLDVGGTVRHVIFDGERFVVVGICSGWYNFIATSKDGENWEHIFVRNERRRYFSDVVKAQNRVVGVAASQGHGWVHVFDMPE